MNMSTNTTKRLRWLALAAVIGSVGFGLAAPASAHDRNDEHGARNWHRHDRDHGHWRHNHWRHGYHRPHVQYYSAPRYVAPPAYYYSPPAVTFGYSYR
jgi:hypothetical protein